MGDLVNLTNVEFIFGLAAVVNFAIFWHVLGKDLEHRGIL